MSITLEVTKKRVLGAIVVLGLALATHDIYGRLTRPKPLTVPCALEESDGSWQLRSVDRNTPTYWCVIHTDGRFEKANIAALDMVNDGSLVPERPPVRPSWAGSAPRRTVEEIEE
jgi:hypothetical protein